MNLKAEEIFAEYEKCKLFKNSLFEKGIEEQSKINERFFAGDQWKGAACGNERPLVRHNIIKRIGDFKMAQIMSSPLEVTYNAQDIPFELKGAELKTFKKSFENNPDFNFSGKADKAEINTVLGALSSYRNVCAERLCFDEICASALKDAYVTGTGIVYTFWDGEQNDIGCEVLSVNNVYFGDVYEKSVEKQPYIIIASQKRTEEVCREAAAFNNIQAEKIKESAVNGKVLVLTKLYKEYKADGSYKIMCTKVTENTVIRKPFDTKLTMYPIAVFCFDEMAGSVYGQSEITYLIPNQIAINRIITAGVWSSMSMGMPLMVVNGDTVSGDITNDPGQIIKIYGSNEDVKGAVNFVTPPDFSANFYDAVQNLIDNTLTQSGATAVVLGNASPDNATALITLRDTALMSLSIVKNRFYRFVEQISRIWGDFFLNYYGDRNLKIKDKNGVWYFPFSAERYKDLVLSANVEVGVATNYTPKENFDILLSLYEKGIIDKEQFLSRIPKGLVLDIKGLLKDAQTLKGDDRLDGN